MAETNPICFIFKTSDDSCKLKALQDTSLKTAKNAADRRKTLKKDQYATVTNDIINATGPEGRCYHSQCLSRYSAVKRRCPVETERPETPIKTTRTCSALPSTDNRGVLQKECVFCGKARKKVKSQNEALHLCVTKDGCRAIYLAAKRKNDTKILALGEDLIAKEIKYHNSCRREYVRDITTQAEPTSSRKIHDEAFRKLSMFIESEIIANKTPMMGSVLLNLYQEEYTAAGGTAADIQMYSVQSLLTKIKANFADIQCDKDSNKSGNFVFPLSMTAEEASAKIKESSKKTEEIRCAAMALRAEILTMPSQKTPSPTIIHILKESAPAIPPLVLFFFDTLINGLQSRTQVNEQTEMTDKRSIAMASDAMFNCSKGTIRPWKHQALGLGLGTLTGSKSVLTILNRLGHSISYDEVKRLETEIAFSCSDGERETPAGLNLCADLATACAWDNYDVNTETPDGKNTLHSTVGICYQNEQPSESCPQTLHTDTTGNFSGRPRRRFDGPMKAIPPFRTSLKLAKFTLVPCRESEQIRRLQQRGLDFVWLLQSVDHKLPLFNRYFSRFVVDSLPKTVVAYMDPISQPPTRNDVVQETMVRAVKVAQEMNQDYAIVSYDLAVALKAYSIQALQTPLFDNLLILLGNFHLEMAFFGAIGTYIADSGIEYLLTEAGVLATGSLPGFLKGKFYNRCTRIHHIVATVMEQALLAKYKESLTDEETFSLQEIIGNCSDDVQDIQTIAEGALYKDLLEKYDAFFNNVMDGQHGSTAAYWAIYVYLINRVYRELQRAIRTNDVKGYIQVLPCVTEIFFALNRPNYARWGSLFLNKLRQMDPKARDILQAGAFSIRRTDKPYSRCAVDLTLEQTVNRDAASPMKGLSAFRNSNSAFRRWSITLTQRGMALSELRQLVGLQVGEQPANQLRPWRVRRDNTDIETLANAIRTTCNPFDPHSPQDLVNVASGKSAKEETKAYLLGTLQRGSALQSKFESECEADTSRFLKTVARTKVMNFAAENTKARASGAQKVKAAEGVRDVFARILALESQTSNTFDLQHILTFPITDVPLSLAHSDGTPNKTDKAALTKLLERKQDIVITDATLPPIGASVVDGGFILHETLLRHSKSTYGTMARDLLVKVCSMRGEEIHLVLDKYVSPSIKDPERKLRGAANLSTFIISGPDQAQRHSGTDLLKNGAFKDEFAHFIMQEWKNPQYEPILGRKVLYVSHGGKCLRFRNTEIEGQSQIQVDEPDHFQAQHEEADTLIAFHAGKIQRGTILVRSTDTDVLVILIGLIGRSNGMSLVMDYGSGNHRRYINVSLIAGQLEEKQSGLTDALIGFHALTGCDFTSAFNRKGKVKPFERLEANTAEMHVKAMCSLTSEVDVTTVTAYVCALYGFNTADIDEARYKAFMRMSGGKQTEPLARLKKINCASLPPCSKTLANHIKRSNYVAKMWKRADEVDPTGGESPTDYGWLKTDDGFQPDWFPGSPVPSSLTKTANADGGSPMASIEDEDTDSVWSEDSDDSEEDDNV